MKTTLKRIFFAGCALFFVIFHPATASDKVAMVGAEVGKWTMDYEAAKKLAGEKKLPMLLNFTGSDWCHWCILMDKNVFAGEAWKEYAADNVVLVTLDFPRDPLAIPKEYSTRNAKLQQEMGVRGYPSYILLDSDAQTVLGQLGAGQDKTPESFVKEVKGVIRFSESSIAAFVKAHPEKADAFKVSLEEVRKVGKEFEAWIATRPERNEENNQKFMGFQKRMQEAHAKFDAFWED